MQIELRPIYGDLPPAFSRMTSPALSPLLRGLSPGSRMIAVGATDGGSPVGLGVARVGAQGSAGEVLSLFVQHARWSQGIGSRLLAALEEALRARGNREVVIRYTTQSPTTAALERILAKRSWFPPKTELVLAQIRGAIADEAGWMRKSRIDLPFELFPWPSLTGQEREAMESFRAEVPQALWPLGDQTPPDPHSSLGLRRNGEIAGWMVTHRAAPTVLRFTMLFVRTRWRTAALSFGLLAEAIRRGRAAYGKQMLGSLAVQVDNAPMLRVLERKFRPWAAIWAESRASGKVLPEAPPTAPPTT